MRPRLEFLQRIALFPGFVAKSSLGLAVLALVIWPISANAFPQYSQTKNTATYCRECHGDFNSGSYVSLHDGVAWNLTLMDGHKSMLDDNCEFCHSPGGRWPVLLNSSTDGISCLACHGRFEPAAEEWTGKITGSGLRQHHYRSGVTVCITCHTEDANPAIFATAPEAQLTPFQQRPAGTYTSGPNDPCNGDGSESTVAPPLGLDNDGDLAYDGSDSDCTMTGVLEAPIRSRLALIGVLPNPISAATRRLQVAFTLPRSGPTILELFDIQGRLVTRREIPAASFGRNEVVLEPPHRAFAGVYVIRLTHAGESVTKKVVLMR